MALQRKLPSSFWLTSRQVRLDVLNSTRSGVLFFTAPESKLHGSTARAASLVEPLLGASFAAVNLEDCMALGLKPHCLQPALDDPPRGVSGSRRLQLVMQQLFVHRQLDVRCLPAAPGGC